MKKIFVITILVLMVAMISVGTAFAQKGKVILKGEVTAIDIGTGTITVTSNKGESFVVTPPNGFELASLNIGDSVLVKGSEGENGILAESIKITGGEGNGEGNGKSEVEHANNGKKPEGAKDNSAYCAEDKQENSHPLSAKIAERYGVTEEWVSEYFCNGYSLGAIMLALKTSEIDGLGIDGLGIDPDTLLADRAEGNAWGKIWSGLGIIGNEKDGHSPPGHLKKPDHAGGPNK